VSVITGGTRQEVMAKAILAACKPCGCGGSGSGSGGQGDVACCECITSAVTGSWELTGCGCSGCLTGTSEDALTCICSDFPYPADGGIWTPAWSADCSGGVAPGTTYRFQASLCCVQYEDERPNKYVLCAIYDIDFPDKPDFIRYFWTLDRFETASCNPFVFSILNQPPTDTVTGGTPACTCAAPLLSIEITGDCL